MFPQFTSRYMRYTMETADIVSSHMCAMLCVLLSYFIWTTLQAITQLIIYVSLVWRATHRRWMNLDHRIALDRITSKTKTSHKVNAFLSASKSLRPAGQLPIGSKRTIHHKITEADGVLPRRRLCVMRQIVAALNEIVANVFAAKHWTGL